MIRTASADDLPVIERFNGRIENIGGRNICKTVADMIREGSRVAIAIRAGRSLTHSDIPVLLRPVGRRSHDGIATGTGGIRLRWDIRIRGIRTMDNDVAMEVSEETGYIGGGNPA